jgi:molybdopterin synthase sulfur carrier subunit
MPTVLVRLPAVLADDAGGQRSVRVTVPAAATVADVLDTLAADHPRLDRRLRDETGALRRHVNLFLGEDDVRAGQGLATAVADGITLLVLPSVAGG